MNKEYALLQLNVQSHRPFERPMINWFLFVFVSVLTGGIFGVYIFIKRIMAVDKFIERKGEYYNILCRITGKNLIPSCFYEIKPLNWFKTCLLMILTAGLYFFVYSYRMNNVWMRLQESEAQFYRGLSNIWMTEGTINREIPFDSGRRLAATYTVNIILTFITGGFWLLVWDYNIHTAPDKLYPQVHKAEDYVADILCKLP